MEGRVTRENSPGAWPWLSPSENASTSARGDRRGEQEGVSWHIPLPPAPPAGTGSRVGALTCSVNTPSRVFTSCAAVEDLGLWSP